MKLEKLYDKQKILHDRIEYEGERRFQLLVFAFKVELYELANELEFFKFWKAQKGKGNALGEYVDGFHFLLDIGLELGIQLQEVKPFHFTIHESTMEQHFNYVDWAADRLKFHPGHDAYEQLFQLYLGLGVILGFTDNQIIEAYVKKNIVNHKRQDMHY